MRFLNPFLILGLTGLAIAALQLGSVFLVNLAKHRSLLTAWDETKTDCFPEDRRKWVQIGNSHFMFFGLVGAGLSLVGLFALLVEGTG